MVKIIKNGRVIDPESRFDGRADLWIENGKIQKIVKKDTKAESDGASDAPSIPADAEVLDAEGLIVAPGLVDVHVHFRDPGLTYKEDIETGAAAAKAGGFTTVVCMANTKPVYSGKGRENGNPCGNLRGSLEGISGKRTDRYGRPQRGGGDRIYG